MTVNLFGRNSSYRESLVKIAERFRPASRLGVHADARRQYRGAGPARAQRDLTAKHF